MHAQMTENEVQLGTNLGPADFAVVLKLYP